MQPALGHVVTSRQQCCLRTRTQSVSGVVHLMISRRGGGVLAHPFLCAVLLTCCGTGWQAALVMQSILLIHNLLALRLAS